LLPPIARALSSLAREISLGKAAPIALVLDESRHFLIAFSHNTNSLTLAVVPASDFTQRLQRLCHAVYRWKLKERSYLPMPWHTRPAVTLSMMHGAVGRIEFRRVCRGQCGRAPSSGGLPRIETPRGALILCRKCASANARAAEAVARLDRAQGVAGRLWQL
jgi:hypothetical protein